MAITIRDVSKYCGLSISAVSKALNNYPDVSEETRQRVLAAARKIGYHPNALARGLKTRRTYNLGVILVDELGDNLQHNYFITILNGFKREAERLGYDITLVNHNIGGKQLSYLDHCRYRNMDGVCLMCVNFYDTEILKLIESDMPVVTIDHLFPNKECVLSDNQSGMESILNYVVNMGHRRIAFVHGTRSNVTDTRLSAFYATLNKLGLTVPREYIIPSHYHSTSYAKEDTRRLMALAKPPSCILMVDDYSALGGMDTIKQLGLRIPEDVSIVGYDGISLIQKIHPRLTTVRQDGEEIGRHAAIRLMDRIENPQSPVPEPRVVPCALIKGETVQRLL